MTLVDLDVTENGFTAYFDTELSDSLVNRLVRWLEDYAERRPTKEVIPLNLGKLPRFTRSVLNFLPALQFSQHSHYQRIAHMVGSPRASRAVGSACGRNPFLLIIPCHRVLASGKKLGGFSAGLSVKQRLLEWEQIGYS